MDELERIRGCLLGLAVGDAVGTSVEFRPRGTFSPVTDMIGGGPFELNPGEWSDDTSMALCLAASLTEKQGFDAADQMDRYCAWYEEGYFSSTGICFDIGGTTAAALHRYRRSGDPFSGSTDPRSAGNGSIMRLAPIPLFYYPDKEAVLGWSAESSRTTHGAAACIEACRALGEILFRALSGQKKEEILFSEFSSVVSSGRIERICAGEYRDKTESGIRGTGYVVESLESALWCFYNSTSFEDAVLMAVNLGDDADTTAAVCGQVAGAHYGESDIPKGWLEKLAMHREIGEMAERLWEVRESP